MAIERKGHPKWTVHPGVVLRNEFMEPIKLSAYRLARELHVSPPTVNEIVRERRAVTADMAVRLAKFFNTSEQFWLNLQASYDVSRARTQLADTIKAIKPLVRHAAA